MAAIDAERWLAEQGIELGAQLRHGAHPGTLERLIARSTDIVVATDRKGTVVYYNDGASRILGYAARGGARQLRRAALSGRRRGEARDERDAQPGAYGERDRARPSRPRFVAKSGEHIPVAISGTLLYDDDGQGRRHDRLREGSPRDPAQGQARDARRGRDRPLPRDQQSARGDREPGRAARARRRATRRRERLLGRERAPRRDPPRDRAHHRDRRAARRDGARRRTTRRSITSGPARMVDLRRRPRRRARAIRASRAARAGGRRRPRHLAQPRRDPRGGGLSVETAADGEEALAQARGRRASISCSPTS